MNRYLNDSTEVLWLVYKIKNSVDSEGIKIVEEFAQIPAQDLLTSQIEANYHDVGTCILTLVNSDLINSILSIVTNPNMLETFMFVRTINPNLAGVLAYDNVINPTFFLGDTKVAQSFENGNKKEELTITGIDIYGIFARRYLTQNVYYEREDVSTYELDPETGYNRLTNYYPPDFNRIVGKDAPGFRVNKHLFRIYEELKEPPDHTNGLNPDGFIDSNRILRGLQGYQQLIETLPAEYYSVFEFEKVTILDFLKKLAKIDILNSQNEVVGKVEDFVMGFYTIGFPQVDRDINGYTLTLLNSVEHVVTPKELISFSQEFKVNDSLQLINVDTEQRQFNVTDDPDDIYAEFDQTFVALDVYRDAYVDNLRGVTATPYEAYKTVKYIPNPFISQGSATSEQIVNERLAELGLKQPRVTISIEVELQNKTIFGAVEGTGVNVGDVLRVTGLNEFTNGLFRIKKIEEIIEDNYISYSFSELEEYKPN